MRSIELDPTAIEDLLWLIQNDRKLALRTLKLIQEAARSHSKERESPSH